MHKLKSKNKNFKPWGISGLIGSIFEFESSMQK